MTNDALAPPSAATLAVATDALGMDSARLPKELDDGAGASNIIAFCVMRYAGGCTDCFRERYDAIAA